MFWIKSIIILSFILLPETSKAAHSLEASEGLENTFTSKVIECSRIVLEHSFDATCNCVVAGDYVLTSLNLLAAFPGGEVLRTELEARSLLLDKEIFEGYRNFIEKKEYAKIFNALFIRPIEEFDPLSSSLQIGGVDIYNILTYGKEEFNLKLINDMVSEKTDHKIQNILSLKDLYAPGIIFLNAYYYKLLWDIPFKCERRGSFKTPIGPKEINYLEGTISGSYVPGLHGDIISVSLKEIGEYLIYKPKDLSDAHPFLDFLKSLGRSSNFYTSSKERKNIFLRMPKVDFKTNIDIKEILKKAQFKGLDEPFFKEKLSLEVFHQKNILKTTLEGIEFSGFAVLSIPTCAPIPITIDVPHYCSAIVQLPDHSYLPLFIGYVGDPTLGSAIEIEAYKRYGVEPAVSGAGAGSET